MSITTYAELQTAVANYLDRTDLSARVPEFIALAEAEFNRGLRNRRMVVRAQATVASQYVQLPSDWLEALNVLSLSNPPYPLRFVTQDQMDRLKVGTETGSSPLYYSLFGDSIEFYPAATVDANALVELVYYGSLPVLSDLNTTNWLLALAPDAYLYGALLQASPYVWDDARVPLWRAGLDAVLASLQEMDERAKYSGGPLVARFQAFG